MLLGKNQVCYAAPAPPPIKNLLMLCDSSSYVIMKIVKSAKVWYLFWHVHLGAILTNVRLPRLI